MHNDANLLDLVQAASAACTVAVEQLLDPGGPVNWADLACIDAERYVSAFGARGHRVYIEEADPAAHALQAFIRDWLAAHGYPDVDVATRW